MRTVHHRSRFALAATFLLALPCTAFAPWGMEGVGVVSTRDTELRASVSPDGSTIVWASPDRAGGPGGGDLWQARRVDGRWQDPMPLALDTAAREADPAFSADGRWLYFASDRAGGVGGDDLYRAPVDTDGRIGAAVHLGAAVNSRGDDRAPVPNRDGVRLMFASDGRGGARGLDLFVARWNGHAFGDAHALPGLATDADECDGAWIGEDAIVFARSDDVASAPVRLFVATCRAGRGPDVAPLALAFNTADGITRAPMVDWNRPVEMLVSGAAPSPKAGRLDVYRVLVPTVKGDARCD
ncbi:TolB family protein [Cognatilysobacter segetis]|uniref:TolB family protein n=1 Tax=Cognatilysobacter segetis TaxID=2492394 RepID=UPI001EE40F93|nr:TolB-like protein [Lysobacter segetis]